MTAGAAPFEYIVMKYREYFGLTWDEFLKIPPEVFYTDLEMIGIESDMQDLHTKKMKNSA